MSGAPRLHVLVNPGARLVETAGAVERAYAPHRDRLADLRLEECAHGDDLADRARQAIARGATAVIAAGGDGTIGAVASALVGGSVPLGVLPLGTFNHFAQDAGLPLGLDEAAAVTVGGRVGAVDVGFVNDRTFLNTATLGVYFDVVETRERWTPRIGKRLAMLVGVLHGFRHPPLLKLDVDVDGRRFRARVPVLWAGNNRYAMHWPVAGTRSRLDEALLTLVLVHETSRLAFVRQIFNILAGRSHLARDIEVSHPREVRIDSRAPHMRVALDGERMELRAPLHVRVERGALPLLVPDQITAPAPPSTSRSSKSIVER